MMDLNSHKKDTSVKTLKAAPCGLWFSSCWEGLFVVEENNSQKISEKISQIETSKVKISTTFSKDNLKNILIETRQSVLRALLLSKNVT